MPDRILAIGDVHGCSRALETILKLISPGPGDLIVTLGDYVDRGLDSKGVIEQLLDLSQRCEVVPLLGNHEFMMLMALEDPAEMNFWLQCGGLATLTSYGGSVKQIPDAHLEFLARCCKHHETPQHIFVHANYIHDLPLAQQPDYALFWEHISYRVPLPHQSGKTAIVGHTPQSSGEILDLGHVIGIDTYCFGTGFLTAMDVETKQVWQVDKFGSPRPK